MTTFTTWLHTLKPDALVALRAFRLEARAARPDSATPVADALETAPAVIRAMPAEFVIMTDHPRQ